MDHSSDLKSSFSNPVLPSSSSSCLLKRSCPVKFQLHWFSKSKADKTHAAASQKRICSRRFTVHIYDDDCRNSESKTRDLGSPQRYILSKYWCFVARSIYNAQNPCEYFQPTCCQRNFRVILCVRVRVLHMRAVLNINAALEACTERS